MDKKGKKKPVVVAVATSLDTATVQNIDWEKCFMCQSSDRKNLVCPANNPNESERNAGYESLDQIVSEIKEAGFEPFVGNFGELNEGTGITATLINHKAKFHKKCKLKLTRQCEEMRKQASSVGLEKRTTRTSTVAIELKKEICFFCGEEATWNKPLHRVETMELYYKLKKIATELGDKKLLSVLSAGDLVAQEGKYHTGCLSNFWNKCRPTVKDERISEKICEGIAFADLCSYIQNKLEDVDKEYVFKMGDLIKMYRERLAQLTGTAIKELPEIHNTRFRAKILANFPQLHPQKKGKEYILISESADYSSQLFSEDSDMDAVAFFRFAKKLRKLIGNETINFEGNLNAKSKEAAVPPALLAVVNTILYGTSVHNNCKATEPAVSIAQLMVFNYHEKSPEGNFVRNNKAREPPLPVYLALSEYGRTRSSETINEMHRFGLSISYNRVTEIIAALCEMVVKRSEEEGILCPGHLLKGIFTAVGYDNIDVNPSSSTSEDSFHGTSMSVFQTPTLENPGEQRSFLVNFTDVDKGIRKTPRLPDDYGIVNVAVLAKKEPDTPEFSAQLVDSMLRSGQSLNDWKDEKEWLFESVHHLVNSDAAISDFTWAAYHASRETREAAVCPALNALLPLFYEKSSSVSMIRHGMDITKAIVKYLNENQVPVMCVDQPLYATAKIIQWNWPDTYGEDKYFVMLGAFHVEQAFLRLIGQFLEGSGWSGTIANSGICSAGAVEAILKVSHVLKARTAHQITAAVLYDLLQEAYIAENPKNSFQEWIDNMAEISPTFYFWLTSLNLIVLLLTFVRSQRSGDYDLYVESLRRMAPWFFIFDHYHYARWLTVYLRDLAELQKKAPSIYAEFQKGKFVLHKTSRLFSAIAVDQAHEQNNASIKGKGGAIGLTQSSEAFNKWALSGPELQKIVKEYSGEDEDNENLGEMPHHEMYQSYQENFRQKCLKLRQSFLELGNPFLESGPELIAIDSRIIISDSGVSTLRSLYENGTRIYETFISDRLVSRTKSVFSPITKNNTKIFAAPKKKPKQNVAIKSLRLDLQLFSRLFIVAQNRELNLDTFFEYENQTFPPALAQGGDLRSGQKADLLGILENYADSFPPPETCDGIVYDGAAVVHSIVPHTSKTFNDYGTEFKLHLVKQAAGLKAKRIDVVWDNYSNKSLKDNCRDARGNGTRRQVVASRAVPTNWPDFLRNADNKRELFEFLGNHLLANLQGFQIVTNIGYTITASSSTNETFLEGVSCSTMEEADGRILLHVTDILKNGAKNVVIRTVDTDVVVIAVSYFFELRELGLRQLWILFGMGKHQRYISADQIALALGEDKSIALRGFHAFTGCDTVSFFHTKGKKSAWNVWQSYCDVTSAFKIIGQPTKEAVNKETFDLLEKFVVLLYDRHSEHTKVNAVRKELFSTKCRELESIPPTSSALRQHTLRAAYQAGQIWGQACSTNPTVSSPEEWGWKIESKFWCPIWSELPDVWIACKELVKCMCTKECATNRCSCKKSMILCTLLCQKCKGSCSNSKV